METEGFLQLAESLATKANSTFQELDLSIFMTLVMATIDICTNYKQCNAINSLLSSLKSYTLLKSHNSSSNASMFAQFIMETTSNNLYSGPIILLWIS